MRGWPGGGLPRPGAFCTTTRPPAAGAPGEQAALGARGRPRAPAQRRQPERRSRARRSNGRASRSRRAKAPASRPAPTALAGSAARRPAVGERAGVRVPGLHPQQRAQRATDGRAPASTLPVQPRDRRAGHRVSGGSGSPAAPAPSIPTSCSRPRSSSSVSTTRSRAGTSSRRTAPRPTRRSSGRSSSVSSSSPCSTARTAFACRWSHSTTTPSTTRRPSGPPHPNTAGVRGRTFGQAPDTDSGGTVRPLQELQDWLRANVSEGARGAMTGRPWHDEHLPLVPLAGRRALPPRRPGPARHRGLGDQRGRLRQAERPADQRRAAGGRIGERRIGDRPLDPVPHGARRDQHACRRADPGAPARHARGGPPGRARSPRRGVPRRPRAREPAGPAALHQHRDARERDQVRA